MHKDIVKIVGETAQKEIGNPPKRGPKKWVYDATMTLDANRANAKEVPLEETNSHKERWKILQSKHKSLTLGMSDGSWKEK